MFIYILLIERTDSMGRTGGPISKAGKVINHNRSNAKPIIPRRNKLKVGRAKKRKLYNKRIVAKESVNLSPIEMLFQFDKLINFLSKKLS